MSTITMHAPGTFCWPELATSDVAAAKAFYTALFGWGVRESPMGDGVYVTFLLGGREAASLYALMPEMRAQGVPPNWGSYVSVENADAAAAKARTLGGQVIREPFDVAEHGRMAVIRDPQGAVFCVWQPKNHIGVQVLAEPGALAWTQLNARDPGLAKPFYAGLLGWTFRDDPAGNGQTYTTWLKSDGMAGGMMALPAEAPAPSHWLVYFAVADLDGTHAKALALGAKSMLEPWDVERVGRFSILTDPQGAPFALAKFLPPPA